MQKLWLDTGGLGCLFGKMCSSTQQGNSNVIQIPPEDDFASCFFIATGVSVFIVSAIVYLYNSVKIWKLNRRIEALKKEIKQAGVSEAEIRAWAERTLHHE